MINPHGKAPSCESKGFLLPCDYLQCGGENASPTFHFRMNLKKSSDASGKTLRRCSISLPYDSSGEQSG